MCVTDHSYPIYVNLREEFQLCLGCVCVCVCVRVCAYVRARFLSHAQLFATSWTVACHAPLSVEFSRQEYWSRLPFPSPGDLSQPRDGAYNSYISCIDRQILYH